MESGKEKGVSYQVNEKREKTNLKKTSQEYKTDDGMKLIIEENGDGEIIGRLEEDLGSFDKENNFRNLLERIRSIVPIKSIDKGYIIGSNGEGEKSLIAKVRFGRVKEFEGLEKELFQQIQLYRNLQKAIEKRMGVEEKRLSSCKVLSDDIEFFTHLEYRKRKDFLEVADFLRELYGIVQIKTGITKQQIVSYHKTSRIAKERAIIAYILRNKFDFLSLSDIGRILGKIKTPKNHATIMNYLERFDKRNFNLEFYKRKRPRELYEKTKKNYETKKLQEICGAN